jgi:hypothetical protein
MGCPLSVIALVFDEFMMECTVKVAASHSLTIRKRARFKWLRPAWFSVIGSADAPFSVVIWLSPARTKVR